MADIIKSGDKLFFVPTIGGQPVPMFQFPDGSPNRIGWTQPTPSAAILLTPNADGSATVAALQAGTAEVQAEFLGVPDNAGWPRWRGQATLTVAPAVILPPTGFKIGITAAPADELQITVDARPAVRVATG